MIDTVAYTGLDLLGNRYLTIGEALGEVERPPLGLKPCLFVMGPEPERKQDVLGAIHRYTLNLRHVPEIWWLELYCHKLVPGGVLKGVLPVRGGVYFNFTNGMSVLVLASDEKKLVQEAQSEYDAYRAGLKVLWTELEAMLNE